jgi:hypothetical protein
VVGVCRGKHRCLLRRRSLQHRGTASSQAKQASTCDALVVYHSKLADAGQNQILEDLGRKRCRVQDADVTLLERQLSSFCTGNQRQYWRRQGKKRKGRKNEMRACAYCEGEPPHRRMLRSLRSELVMPSGLDIADDRRETCRGLDAAFVGR